MNWSTLFMTTIRMPDHAAAYIKGLELERAVLWMGILAVSAMGAVFTGLTVMMLPLPPEFPRLFAQPFAHFAAGAGGMVLFAHILTWVGRALGGTGSLDDMTKLIIWLQAVRVGLQSFGLLLLVSVPVLGSFYSLITVILSIWILVQFIRVGHSLPGSGTAVVVLIATFVGLIVGTSLLLTLIGVGSIGLSPNV